MVHMTERLTLGSTEVTLMEMISILRSKYKKSLFHNPWMGPQWRSPVLNIGFPAVAGWTLKESLCTSENKSKYRDYSVEIQKMQD